MDNLKEYFTSKKFWVMIIGSVVAVLIEVIPALAEYQGSLEEIIWLAVAYIIGQGLAEFGKHAR